MMSDSPSGSRARVVHASREPIYSAARALIAALGAGHNAATVLRH
jgi:hypothetical protein